MRTHGTIITLRFSGGKGGGSEIDDVRSASRPRTRRMFSGGVSVAERSTVEEASRKIERQRSRRVEADEREADAGCAALHDRREVRSEHGEHGGEALQREVEVQDGIVDQREARLPLPGEVAHAASAPTPRATRGAASRGGSISAIASPSGRSSAHSARIAARSSIEATMSANSSPGWRTRRLRRTASSSSRISGEKICRARSGKVVRLVDQQDRVAQVLARQVTERGGRLEDVVVVGDDRVGALGELELDLEGADLLAPRLFEDDVRVVVGVGVAQAPEEVRPLHLLRVAPGEAAEVLVADDPVVGAHPVLGADLDRVERALVHGHERRDRHLLLQGLGRQEDDLPAGREALGEGRVESRGRLARARRRLGEQVLAGFGRPGGPPRSSFPGPGRGAVCGKGSRSAAAALRARTTFWPRQMPSARASRRSTSRSTSSSKGTCSESSSPVSMST